MVLSVGRWPWQKIDFFDGCFESCLNSNCKLMKLKNNRYEVDQALEYHLNQIDDWSIFGSFGFRYKASLERLKFCFYKLIRAVERNNRGQFVVKFEGDNRARERHFHFLLGSQGLITDNCTILRRKLYMQARRLAFSDDFPEFKRSTSDIQKFNPALGAKTYISKIVSDEKENLFGAGLDSAGNSNWKLSPSLKRRLKRINSSTLENFWRYMPSHRKL